MRWTLDQWRAEVARAKQTPDSRRARRKDAEAELQSVCVAWWRSNRLTRHLQLIAIPNEGKRTPRAAARLKRMGMVPGTADLLAMWANGTSSWIEMKSPTGTLTDDQEDFQEWCLRLGLPYHVVRTFREFEQIALDGVRRQK